ncbi:hypothetical protein FQN57_003058 [Myotisia sp. PD_48]|nr:hypothetical protein FQN57_003058 [Myotisia sp. PD_48]
MKLLTALALAAATPVVFANTAFEERAPNAKFLIETAPGETRWVTEAEKWELKKNDINFFDITDQPQDFAIAQAPRVYAFPSAVKFQTEVKEIITKLSSTAMQTDLRQFSSYNNRYYQAQTGVTSANWLFDQVKAAVANIPGAKVEKVTHRFIQPSIRAIIPGKGPKIIVVGAHEDSINSSQPQGRAPGADDNGSGSITILHGLRALAQDPKIAAGEALNTIEFHWYAGEEAGLLGSQDIFAQYRSQQKQVAAMLNQDMTGYGTAPMGIITDNVDRSLTSFTRLVLAAYCTFRNVDSTCGYACSDHASANRNGFPSAFVFETAMSGSNPYIHTANDTIDRINFNKVLDHAKLVVGFVYELAFSAL